MRRALLCGLVLLLLLFVLLPLGALLALRSRTGQRWLARQLERAAQERLAGRLHIERLDLRLPARVVLRDVTLADAEGHQAVAVRELAVEIDPWSLVTRRIVARRFDAKGVSVHARRLADGRINLTALATPSSGTSQRSFDIEHAAAVGAVDWQGMNIQVRATGWLQLGAAGTQLSLQGELAPPTGSAHVRVWLDGERWSAALHAAGVPVALPSVHAASIDGEAQLDPHGWRARVAARDAVLLLPLGGGPAHFTRLSARLSVERAAAQVSLVGEGAAHLALAAHGRVDWSASGVPRAAALTLDRFELVHGRARIRSLTPARIELGPSLSIENARLTIDDARLALANTQLALTARLESGLLHGRLSVRANHDELSAAGDLPLPLDGSRPLALEIQGRTSSLARWRSLLPGAPDGPLRFTLRARGTMRRPRLALTVDGSDLSRGSIALARLAARFDYRDRRLAVHAFARLGGRQPTGSLGLDAALPIAIDLAPLTTAHAPRLRPSPRGPLDATLRLDGLALAELPPSLRTRAGLRAGLASGTLALGGSLTEPRVHGELSVRGLATKLVRGLDAALRFHFADGRGAAALEADLAGEPLLVAHGTVTLRPSGLAAWRDAPFSFDAVVPDFERGRGGLSAQVHASGRLGTPRGHVRVRAHDVELEGARLRNARLDGDSDGTALTARLSAEPRSGGKLDAHGTLMLDGLSPTGLQLAATLEKIPVAQGPIGAWVDAELTLRGRRGDDGRTLTGTLTLDRGTLHLPKLSTSRRLQSTAPHKDVVFVDARAKPRPSVPLPAARLDTRVRGPIHVRGPELSTDLDGELTIHVDGGETRVSGVILADGGWVDLLGRRFRIARMQLGFDGAKELDPTLDIRLEREFADSLIGIEAHGRASKPELAFSSSPPIYDETEIMGIIVTGDPANARVTDRALDQRLVGALSTVIVGKLKEQVLPVLPIDVLRVDTGETGYTGITTTRMEMGKYITDTIFASYVHQFGVLQLGTRRLNANEANVEWRFRRHFSLTTRFGDAGAGALDLFWTLRY
jgi:autotransporter translocation and assembly factor TamB